MAGTPKRSTPEVVYFVDRCLGREVVPKGLREAGLRVEIHDDHFPANAKDTDWLPVVAARGWVVLTKDEHIRRRPLEREALLAAGARAFVLTARRLRGGDMANAFVRARRRMEALLRDRPEAFIAGVTRHGGVSVIVRARGRR